MNGAARTTPPINARSKTNANPSPGRVVISRDPGGSARRIGPSTKSAIWSTKKNATPIPAARAIRSDQPPAQLVEVVEETHHAAGLVVGIRSVSWCVLGLIGVRSLILARRKKQESKI